MIERDRAVFEKALVGADHRVVFEFGVRILADLGRGRASAQADAALRTELVWSGGTGAAQSAVQVSDMVVGILLDFHVPPAARFGGKEEAVEVEVHGRHHRQREDDK